MRKRYGNVKLLCGVLVCALGMVMSVSGQVNATGQSPLPSGSYTVTANMTNLSFSGSNVATNGQDYTATLANNGGCSMPDSISVSIGGTNLAAGSDTYSYDAWSAKITIKGNAINGNVIISAVAKNHQWSDNNVVMVGPSCTSAGSTGNYCKVCGMVGTGSGSVAATGHKFVNYVSNDDATCFKEGTKTATCSNPGCTATSTIKDTGSKKSHTSTGKRINVKTASCLEEGYTGDLLCVCGEIMKYGQKMPITEHDSIVIGAEKPSCIVDGYTGDTVCRYCDVVLEEGTVIEALDKHSFGDWNTVLEATDMKVGRQERICSMCGMKESELIVAGRWSEVLLILAIIGLVILSGAVVGLAVYFMVKNAKAVPETMPAIDDASAEITVATTATITMEESAEENL